MLKLSCILLIICSFFSCCSGERQESVRLSEKHTAHVPDSSDWRKMTCGLFMSPEGELGFASNPEIANFNDAELIAYSKKTELCENQFLTTFGHEGEVRLYAVIDTTTFESIGAGFFKDKNHIYSHYEMCDGGYFKIFSSDTSSFRLLNAYYMSYKDEIYYYRWDKKIDADFKTFKVSNEFGMLAKDKNGFFDFGERVTEQELISHTNSKEAIANLKKL